MMNSNNFQLKKLDTNKICDLFHNCFLTTENTKLISSSTTIEPIYIPSNKTDSKKNEIYFVRNCPHSALHEIAHWLIAGKKRRQLIDYGYWYEKDGRSALKQHEFYKVESAPQALELVLSMLSGISFHLSTDNLNNTETGSQEEFLFATVVVNKALQFIDTNLDDRKKILYLALLQYNGLSIDFINNLKPLINSTSLLD